MNPSSEEAAFERYKRKLIKKAINFQENMNIQIDDFQTFINQQFADYITSIESFVFIPKSAQISLESPPQSEQQQHSSSDSGGKSSPDLPVECENGEVMPMDLSCKKDSNFSAQSENIESPPLDNVNTLQNEMVNISNSNSHFAQNLKVVVPETGILVQPKQAKSALHHDPGLKTNSQTPKEDVPKAQTTKENAHQTSASADQHKKKLVTVSQKEGNSNIVNRGNFNILLPSTSGSSTSTANKKDSSPSTSSLQKKSISFPSSKTNIEQSKSSLELTLHKNAESKDVENAKAETVKRKIIRRSIEEALALPQKKSSSSTQKSSSSSVSKREKRPRVRSSSKSSSRSSSYDRDRQKKAKKSQSSSRHYQTDKRSKSGSSDESGQTSSDDDEDSSSSLEQPPKNYRQFIVKNLFCSLSTCSEKFSNIKKLHEHLENDHTIGPYKCPLYKCDFRAYSRKELNVHQMDSHYNCHRWTCDECPETFNHSKGLATHFNYKHILGEFSCSVKGCPKVSGSKCNAYDHFSASHLKRNGHLREGFVIRAESLQRQTTPSSYKFLDFRKTNHMLKVLQLKCTVSGCRVWAAYEGELNRHLKEAHGIGHYRCSISKCGASFSTPYDLKVHSSNVHLIDDWSCGKCRSSEDAPKSGFQLAIHNNFFHERGLFKCVLCGFADKLRIRVFEHYELEHETFD